MIWTFHGANGSDSFSLVPWLIQQNGKWRLQRYFSYQRSEIKERWYVLLFLGPVDRKILNSKPFPEIGYDFRDSVDDMCNFIADDEFDILK